MGFRFRKSKSIGPFRFTMSKRGMSSSIGGKGVRLTRRADGKTQYTVGIPGTGLSYTETLNDGKSSAVSASNDPNQISSQAGNTASKPSVGVSAIIAVIFFLVALSALLQSLP